MFDESFPCAVSRRQAVAGLSALAAAAGLPRFSFGQKVTNPEERLQKQFGLVRLSGIVWGLPLELELKEKLAQLKQLEAPSHTD